MGRPHPGLWGLVCLMAGCAIAPPHPYTLAEDFDPSRVERVYLAPVNATRPLADELVEGADTVRALVRERLEGHGWVVVEDPFHRYRNAWRAAFVGIAPAPGKPGEGPTYPVEGIARLVDALRHRHEFEAMLIPDLVGRAGRLSGSVVRWDGVSRRIEIGGAMLQGQVRVISLRLLLYGPGGEAWFESIGGLDLTFDPQANREETKPVLLGDEAQLRRGVNLAFHPLLPFPEH